MYRPEIFREERVDVMHALVRAHPFATLVTSGSEGPEANHLPLVLHAGVGTGEAAELGVLRGHVARANPLWESVDRRVDALAIFHGPQAYITPSWYPVKAVHGKVVPTWNYAVVHARGRLVFYDERERLRAHVAALTAQQEASRTAPWALSDAPADFIDALLNGIVGFELAITRLEGKWKMSQNQDAANRAGVVDGLMAESSDTARAVAELITL